MPCGHSGIAGSCFVSIPCIPLISSQINERRNLDWWLNRRVEQKKSWASFAGGMEKIRRKNFVHWLFAGLFWNFPFRSHPLSDTLLDICGMKAAVSFLFSGVFERFCVFRRGEINISTHRTTANAPRSAEQFSLWSARSCKWILLCNWFSCCRADFFCFHEMQF